MAFQLELKGGEKRLKLLKKRRDDQATGKRIYQWRERGKRRDCP